MNAVRAAGIEWSSDSPGVSPGVQLNEWQREGWTYHAKGAHSLRPLLRTRADCSAAYFRRCFCSTRPDMAQMNFQGSGCVPPQAQLPR